jgi:hypothetical protein
LPLALARSFVSLAGWLMATGYAFCRVLRHRSILLRSSPFPQLERSSQTEWFLSAALIGGGSWPWTRGRRSPAFFLA